MLAYVVGKICAVDGYELLYTLGYVPRQLHDANRQKSISVYCTDFTYNIRQHISSLRGIQELPEDGNKLPKYVGAQG
jgi:hypothetical protein